MMVSRFIQNHIPRKLFDCSAEVTIDGARQQLTCMPDKMAYAEMKNGADSAMQ
jgi:hypothetical protein